MDEVTLLDVNSKVTKEGYELIMGVKNIISDLKVALSDGWQPGSDIPVILTSTIGNLGVMVQGADKVGSEVRLELPAFTRGMMLGAHDIGFLFYEKPVAVVAPQAEDAPETKPSE